MADSSNAQIGKGVALDYWDEVIASPPAYASVGKVRSLSGFGQMKPEVDSTTLDSTAVERIGGLPDGKEVTVTLTTRGATLELLESWMALTTAVLFKLNFPAPTSKIRYFSMIVLDIEQSQVTPSGLMEITFKGRITGAIASTDPHA